MIIFQTMSFRNLLSFGPDWQTIRFDNNKSVLVKGENGTGKSAALLDAICFGLFGKPFRKVPKNHIINTQTKKQLCVKLNFENYKGDQYQIIRSLLPNSFEIYENDQLLNQTKVKDTQGYLEKHILKIDYNTFCQLVVLGKANYISFLKSPLQDRRKFIENILNLAIISQMNEINKLKLNEVKNKLQIIKNTIELITQKINLIEINIADLKSTLNKHFDEQIEKLNQLVLEKINIKNTQLTPQLQIIEDTEAFEVKLKSLNELQLNLKSKQSQLKKRMTFFLEEITCPVCDYELTSAHRQDKIANCTLKFNEIEIANKTLATKLTTLKDNITLIQQKKSINNQIENKISAINHEIKQLNLQISNLKQRQTQFNNDDIQINEKINELVLNKQLLTDKLVAQQQLEKCYQAHNHIYELLKDSGIRRDIIKNYLPKLNYYVNYFLTKFNKPLQFTLNDEFDETIYHNDCLIYYNGLSEGEKLRIDVAFLFAIRKLLGLNNFNFLILDEILDSSLDKDGIMDFLALLKEETSIKIFCISHNHQTTENTFDEVYSVIKTTQGASIVRE